MRATQQGKSAFTLVELLVVIAIVGILVALMLPAIQAAREAARRTACINNLKQIGMALLNYHDAHKQFPLGGYGAVMEDAKSEEDALGWATRILPQLEEHALYDRIENNTIAGYEGNPWITSQTAKQNGIFKQAHLDGMRPIAGGETVLSVFLCPSADLPLHMPDRSYFGEAATDLEGTGYATAHYKASRGYCDRGMFWPPKEGALEREDCQYDINGDGIIDLVPRKPITRVRIQDVTDGTSKTIMIGEAAYFARYQAFPLWMGMYGDDGSIMFETKDAINCGIGHVRSFPLAESDEDRLELIAGPEPDDCTFSWHTGGAYFAFVDGSVRFLNEEMDFRTFRLYGDRMDDEIIRELE